MKKLFTIIALTVLTLTAGAQEKKSWLFYEGLSDETIANLNADAANWASNGTDAEGNTNNWKNAVKQSADSYWMANGEVIEELRGLKIDIGSNKDNSVHLATTKIRLTRKNTIITFPKLANGQKITIQGRSANSSATNRGIAPVQSYLEFQADESSSLYNGACIFLGNQVEGSEGTYTFVWKVVTEETDSVDVQFKLTPDAGIDFTYFMIDNGDAPDVEEAQPVGYVYSGSLDDDYAYIYLSGSEKFALTEINADETEATADSLQKFQAIVVSPTIAAGNAYLSTIKQAIAYVPVLNLNPAIYEALGYGTATPSNSGVLAVAKTDYAAFEGIDMEIAEGVGVLPLLDGANITGVKLDTYFAKDDIIAFAGEPTDSIVAMHLHNAKRNAYLLLPLPLESMAAADQNVISTLIPQSLQAVAGTKKEITAVGTPVITPKQLNGETQVSITAANSIAIYYTLDGTEPTIESTLYTEPFTLTAPTTVKAFATGDGYTDSKVAEKDIIIMTQAQKPQIAVSREQGKSTITLTTATEGVNIYFSFNGATTAAASQLYSEPIELTETATITALAEGGEYLPSELATQFIGIDGLNANTIRLDTLAHFDANETDWFVDNSEFGGEGKASAYYYWGKNAWSYYSEEIDHQETVKDSEGNDSIVYYYKPNPYALKVVNPNTENGWVMKSCGQVLTGELQLSVENKVGNGATGRYAEEAIDLITPATKGAITFGTKVSGEPYTASIETTDKYAGPFDVVVFCGNGNNGSKADMEVQVSADGETWTAIGNLKLADTQRYIKRTRLSYEETTEVYVRVAQVGGSTKAQVYDILVLNNGELSKQYNEDTQGISTLPATVAASAAIYNMSGVRQQQLSRGLNIIVGADGSVRKVMVK